MENSCKFDQDSESLANVVSLTSSSPSQSSNDCNHPFDQNNQLLCKAVVEDNIEMINYLLSQTKIDVNCVDVAEKKMPLHMACTVETAHILIKNGADVNARYNNNITALYDALEWYDWHGNLEMICMLLYYGANVNVTDDLISPLLQAITSKYQEVCPLLINYYDDFSREYDCSGLHALDYAIKDDNPVAFDIIKAGASVNYINDYEDFPLLLALEYNNAELFEVIWNKFDYKILLDGPKSLPLSYVRFSNFATPKWLNYLYLILTLPNPFPTKDRNYCSQSYGVTNECDFWCILLRNFVIRNIAPKDRISIIYICLKLGITVDTRIVNYAHHLFGFSDEMEAFIYTSTLHVCYLENLQLLPTFILAWDDDSCIKQLLELFHQKHFICLEQIFNALGFFSIPFTLKQCLKELTDKRKPCRCCTNAFTKTKKDVLEKLDALPQVPSLVELNRNQIRKCIKQNVAIKHPYQFHDAVKSLKLPELIQDIVRFKRPIY